MPRLGLAITIGCTLILTAALGAHIALVCSHDIPVRADLQIIAVILIAWGLNLSWRWVKVLVAQAVRREQQTEREWSAVADRFREGGAGLATPVTAGVDVHLDGTASELHEDYRAFSDRIGLRRGGGGR